MPKVKVNEITVNYEQQGSGEHLVMIPYLSADNACYAFQLPEYAKHFTCTVFDPRGTGETDKPEGVYSTEDYADDLNAFMSALDIDQAHIYGQSFGAGVGLWFAAKYPERVRSLSVHGGWGKTDPFLRTVVEGWQIMAKALGNVTEMVITSIFPWCFTPELYAARPDFIDSIKDFARSRPEQPVDAFLQQSNAVIGHDVEPHLGKILAPTQITVGQYDMITSTRFADRMRSAIKDTELLIFENCAHAPLYEKIEEFNGKTLEFLTRHTERGLSETHSA